MEVVLKWMDIYIENIGVVSRLMGGPKNRVVLWSYKWKCLKSQ